MSITTITGNHRVTIVGYELGYRFSKATSTISDFKTPYVDLGMFASLAEGNAKVRQLQKDFPNAEWRLVEVWDAS